MNQRKQVPWSAQRARARAALENREEPDFAPDPEDQETLEEIQDAIARQRAMDNWETWEDGEEPELDDFGNPIPVKKERKRVPWATHKAWAISALRDARNNR